MKKLIMTFFIFFIALYGISFAAERRVVGTEIWTVAKIPCRGSSFSGCVEITARTPGVPFLNHFNGQLIENEKEFSFIVDKNGNLIDANFYPAAALYGGGYYSDFKAIRFKDKPHWFIKMFEEFK